MGDGWEGCCHHPPAFLLHCPISLGLFSPRRGTSCGKDSCGDRARVHQFGTSAWASCVKVTEAKLVVVVKRWRYTPDSRYFPRKKFLRQVCSHVVWLVSVWLTRLKSKGTGAFKHPSSRGVCIPQVLLKLRPSQGEALHLTCYCDGHLICLNKDFTYLLTGVILKGFTLRLLSADGPVFRPPPVLPSFAPA